MCSSDLNLTFDFDAKSLWLMRGAEWPQLLATASQGRYGAKVGVPKILELLRDEELKGLAKGIEQAQQGAMQELQRTTGEGLSTLQRAHEDSLQSLRRTHEDQSNRLQKAVQEQAGWNKAMLAVLGVVALGMAALLVAQLFK